MKRSMVMAIALVFSVSIAAFAAQKNTAPKKDAAAPAATAEPQKAEKKDVKAVKKTEKKDEKKVEKKVEKKEAALADTEHQIAMEVIKAYADATSALHNLEASATLLEAAQNALAVSQRKYDKGAADIMEILNTQRSLSDAQEERIRCLSEWRSARLRLLASAGEMGRSAVAER